MSANNKEVPIAIQHTEYGIPIRNLWHMLLYAWSEFSLPRYWALQEVEQSPTLDALLASILADMLQQRIRIGLGRDYVPQCQSVRGIRGRVKFAESLKRQTFTRRQIFCEFQEYSENAPKNQIIRSTLARLAETGDFGADDRLANELRHKLRSLVRAMNSIDIIELKPAFIRRQQLGHNDRDYRLMFAICELILLRHMPSETLGQNRLPPIDKQSLALNVVYEKFVANFYRLRLNKCVVKPQRVLRWNVKQENPYLPIMKPDLIIEERSSGKIVMLDTKFTAKSLSESPWGKQLFSSSHLYQMYAYLNTQNRLSEHHQRATGILLYPAASRDVSEKIELENHAILIESVNLTAPWQEIENQLLEIISRALA